MAGVHIVEDVLNRIEIRKGSSWRRGSGFVVERRAQSASLAQRSHRKLWPYRTPSNGCRETAGSNELPGLVLERGKDAYEWPGDGLLLTGRTSIEEIAKGRDEIIRGNRFASIHIVPGPDPRQFERYTWFTRPEPLVESTLPYCVDREVPAFLVAWWNLHFANRGGHPWTSQPVQYPFAVQPAGTGKTFLGEHLINILNRPRQDRRIEEPLLKAIQVQMPFFQDSMIECVLEDSRTEGVVVRALRNLLSGSELAQTRITKMMKARTFLISFTRADNVNAMEAHILDTVLRYALNALQIDPTSDGQLARQLANVTAESLGETLCHLAAGPVFLVFDDIYAVLPQENSSNRAALHLFLGTVFRYGRNVDFFMYCTSRSTSTALRDLDSANPSRMRAEPVLMQNLSADNIKEMIANSPRLPFPVQRVALLDRIAADILDLTGGVARVADCCVTALSNLPPFDDTATDEEIFHECQRNAEAMVQIFFPPRTRSNDHHFERGDHGYNDSTVVEAMFRHAVMCACTNVAILNIANITVTSSKGKPISCLLKDLLVVWGINYESALDVPGCFRVTPGRFVVQYLLGSAATTNPAVKRGILPQIFRGRGVITKAAPFPLMIAEALSHLSAICSGSRVTQALPFLKPYLEDKTDTTLQPLQAVMLPQLSDDGQILSVEDMGELMATRDVWHGPPVIAKKHRDWLILEWLGTHCIGLPAQPSSSQDVFLKLPHLALGFAMKAFHGTKATQRHVEEEWAVAPSQLACVNADTHYIMLFCSLRLDADLTAQVASSPSYKSVCCSDSSRTTLILNPAGNMQAFDELLGPGATERLTNCQTGAEFLGLSMAITRAPPVEEPFQL